MKNLTPVTREEKYLYAIATHGEIDITPTNTKEELLDAILHDVKIEINPKTREEYFLNEIVNSEQINKTYILEPVEVTFENGEFSPENIILSKEDVLAIPRDALAQIGDTVLKFNSIYQELDVHPTSTGCLFTDNGEEDDLDDPSISVFEIRFSDEYSSGSFSSPDGNMLNYVKQENYVSGTYTVSIYTETDEAQPVQPKEAFEDNQEQEADRP